MAATMVFHQLGQLAPAQRLRLALRVISLDRFKRYLKDVALKYAQQVRKKVLFAIKFIQATHTRAPKPQIENITPVLECSYGLLGGLLGALPTTKTWFSRVALGCAAAAAIYGAVKLHISYSLALRHEADRKRSAFMQEQYNEILEAMEEQRRTAIRDRIDDLVHKEVIEEEELDDMGNTVRPEVVQYITKEHGKFVRNLVGAAKLEFGGVPKTTEANMLAVWRFLYRKCEKQKLNPCDAERAITAALPFVFIPSCYDESAAITRTSEETIEALRRYKEQFVETAPLRKLLCNPLSGKAWRAWARQVLYGDQETGLHFAK
nr:RNA polymerase pre-readthrough protein [Maize mild mottle virus]